MLNIIGTGLRDGGWAALTDGALQPALIVTGILQGLGYGILAVGLVLIYRATGIINVAYGAVGGCSAAVLVVLVDDHHFPYWAAMLGAIATGIALSLLTELIVVRRLSKAPRVTALVATVGLFEVLVYLTASITLRSDEPLFPTPIQRIVDFGPIRLTGKDLLVIAVVPALVTAISLFLSRTPTGLAIRASAENPDAAKLAGVPQGRVSVLVWALAGALAAVSTSLVDAQINLIPQHGPVSVGPSVLLAALAAALLGKLTSLPLALLGGIAVGVLRVESQVIFDRTRGVPELLIFILILIGVGLLPKRSSRSDESSLGLMALNAARPLVPQSRGRVAHSLLRWSPLLAAALLPLVVTDAGDLFLAERAVLFAVLGLSALILTGWAGQVSLGQIALFGVGALLSGALVAHGVPYWIALIEASFGGALVAVVIGLPALRLRGLLLAVTTLSFAVAAQQWLFALPLFGHGDLPLVVTRPLGLQGDRTWYLICLSALATVTVVVARLRRSAFGLALIATRANEDAASALGIAATRIRLVAFALSGAIAAGAGALFAAAKGAVIASDFGIYDSLTVIAILVVGGIGSVAGPLIGAALLLGLPALVHASALVSLLTSGLGLLGVLLYLPGGLVGLRSVLLGVRGGQQVEAVAPPDAGQAIEVIARLAPPREILVAGNAGVLPLAAAALSVSYGGRRVLDDVSLRLEYGEILGLIGANGAGKSTLLNVLGGYVTADAGSVLLHGEEISAMAPHLRARRGMGRTFQDARLFNDLSVLETLTLACATDKAEDPLPVIGSSPRHRRRQRAALACAEEHVQLLGLGQYAHYPLQALSTGTRRVLELGCLLVGDADVLLLDEPTAGLAQKEVEAFAPTLHALKGTGRSILLVEHDVPLVMQVADRVHCLSVGKTISEGSPSEVRADPAVIATYLGGDRRAIERSGTLARI